MRTERGLDRLITFLDAVVAIAITVLVLPLTEILSSSEEDADLGTVLREEAPQLGAFLLSFVVIARLWLVHHRLVERVGGYDRPFVLINVGWLLTIVVLPFATQVTAVYGTDRGAIAIYVGTITIGSALLTALSVLLWRRPGLRREGSPAVNPASAVATTALFAVAFLVAVLVPPVNYFALFLLFLSGPAERLAARRYGGPPNRRDAARA
jgi:uncharacterized membrane protein